MLATTLNPMTAANDANIEVLRSFAATTLASLERVTALNLNTARAALDEYLGNASEMADAADLQELLYAQSHQAQPAVEKAVSYYRDLYEIFTRTQEQFSKIFEGHFGKLNKDIEISMSRVVQSAPATSEFGIAAVKSVFSAANSVYESMSRITKQMAGIAQANIDTASDTATKVAGVFVGAKRSAKKTPRAASH